jgi:hypothetical protein
VSALRAFPGVVSALMLAMPLAVLADQSRPAAAQAKPGAEHESKSEDLAGEFKQMLDTMKLNSFAAKHADGYVGALYMPGIQLLVVGGKFTSGERMNYLIEQKSYREAYSDLNSASERTSRILISDLGPSGLHFKREKDQPFDIVDVGGKSLSFDGKWGGKDNPSREEYSKTFDTTDEQYSQMLQVLIEALKKSS